MLTHALLDFLLTPPAQAALQGLASADLRETAWLGHLSALRKTFTAAQAGALLEQACLRVKAVGKFPDAAQMWFVDEALQQASARAVAEYHAQIFAGQAWVADLGCGIGADTLALAATVPTVYAVERDSARARITAHNAAVRGVAARVQVVCGDWRTLAWRGGAAFIDPARRVGERRVFTLAAMEPPLEAILGLRSRVAEVAVKVAPGVDHAEIPAEAEVDFISEDGEMKEACLRFGALRTGAARRAVRFPGPLIMDSHAPLAEDAPRAPGAFFYEPDPALLRAGLVRALAAEIGAAQIDETIAYLTADSCVRTPWARVWRVTRHGPFNLKGLNTWVRAAGAGEVIVKKRGAPIDPDEIRRKLKTTAGGPVVTAFITRVQGRPWMVLAEGV